MNKLLYIYTLSLLAFAVYLAYLQFIWLSVLVLGMSFAGYALLIGSETLKNKNR